MGGTHRPTPGGGQPAVSSRSLNWRRADTRAALRGGGVGCPQAQGGAGTRAPPYRTPPVSGRWIWTGRRVARRPTFPVPYPAADQVGQDRQQQRARAEDGVVERPDVEPVAEPAFGLGPHPLDLQPADHVGQRGSPLRTRRRHPGSAGPLQPARTGRCGPPPQRRRTDRSVATSGGCCSWASSSAGHDRVDGVLDPVADQADRQHDDQQRQPREVEQPGPAIGCGCTFGD